MVEGKSQEEKPAKLIEKNKRTCKPAGVKETRREKNKSKSDTFIIEKQNSSLEAGRLFSWK